jgi:hypothetical protein
MLAATLQRFNDLPLHAAKLAAAQVEAYKMIRIRKSGSLVGEALEKYSSCVPNYVFPGLLASKLKTWRKITPSDVDNTRPMSPGSIRAKSTAPGYMRGTRSLADSARKRASPVCWSCPKTRSRPAA